MRCMLAVVVGIVYNVHKQTAQTGKAELTGGLCYIVLVGWLTWCGGAENGVSVDVGLRFVRRVWEGKRNGECHVVLWLTE